MSRTSDNKLGCGRGFAMLRIAPALVLSAYVLAAALATPKLPWLGLLAILPVLWSVRVLTPVWACIGGAVWGVSLLGFAQLFDSFNFEITLTNIALVAGAPALYAFLGSVMTRRIGFSPFLLSYGWILVELAIRPLAFRHGLLAGTQENSLLLSLLGRGLGYVSIALVLAFASAWLVEIIVRVRNGQYAVTFSHCIDKSVALIVLRTDRLFARCVPAISRPRAPPALASLHA